MSQKYNAEYLLRIAQALADRASDLLITPICLCGAEGEMRDGIIGFNHIDGCSQKGFTFIGIQEVEIPDC